MKLFEVREGRIYRGTFAGDEKMDAICKSMKAAKLKGSPISHHTNWKATECQPYYPEND